MSDFRRLKITIEYDGTDFVGWQFQENGRSVQEGIELAASELLQEKIRVVGAGRTDSGVHARGQVAHFDTMSNLDAGTIHRGLNALLQEDVTIHNVEDVDNNFHSRFSASSRSYIYSLSHNRIAINRKYSWIVYYHLNHDAIQEAVSLLKGTHDFTAFSKYSDDVEHCYCNVFNAEWKRDGASSQFYIKANRFVYGMVRIIVGALVDVGRGKIPVADFKNIFEKKERSPLFTVAPAYGLNLENVRYDSDEFEVVKKIMDELKREDKI